MKADSRRRRNASAAVMGGLAAIVGLASVCGSPDAADLPSVADLTRIAGLPRIEDAYKHLYQAYLGPEHAISSREAAAAYLREEWVGMGVARPGEDLIEPLVEGAPFVRVHLRPYRDLGGHRDSLLAAFVRSASVRVDTTAFLQAWSGLREVVERGGAAFTLAAYDSLDARVRAHGFPSVHHSRAYSALHAPAYRVLSRGEAKSLLRALPDQSHRR